jgi:hypothetical protein
VIDPATQIWIMCQGEQRRLAHLGHPKHLLEVNGEPILRRTLRLLRELDAPHPVVVGRGDLTLEALLDAEKRGACEDKLDLELGVTRHRVYHRHATLDDPGNCILDGIAAIVNPNADARTVVLLGDVVWSRDALTSVMVDDRPLFFAGTTVLSMSQGEIFAVAWTDHKEMTHLLDTVACRRAKWSQQQGGHLRRLLWWAQNRRRLPPVQSSTKTWHPNLYLEITDWTTDIDDDADLQALPEISARCAAEI